MASDVSEYLGEPNDFPYFGTGYDAKTEIATISIAYAIVADIASPAERGSFVGAVLLGSVNSCLEISSL